MRTNSSKVPGRIITLLCCAGGLAGVSGAAFGQYQPRVVAYAGQPTGAVSKFVQVDGPAIAEDGGIVFWGWEGIDTEANDECAGAIDVGVGHTTISNTLATTSAEPAWCGTNDVWLRFTAASSTAHQLHAFRCVGVTNDAPAVALYTGGCGKLQLVSESCSGGRIDFNATIGQTYSIRVGARSPDEGFPQRWTATIDIIDVGSNTLHSSPRTRQRGVWTTRDDGVPLVVVREGDVAAFDPTRTFRSTYFPAIAPGEDISFLGVTRGNSVSNEPTVASLLRSIDAAPFTEVLRDDTGFATAWRTPMAQVNDSGRLAYALNDGSQLVYGATTLASGVAAPGTPAGVTYQYFDQPVSSAGVAIVWRSRLQGANLTDLNNLGLWVDRGSGVQLLARTASSAPGTSPGTVWKDLNATPAITDAGGVVAFHGLLDGATVTNENNIGIWRGTPGSIMLLARTTGTAPGVPGAIFQRLEPTLRINRAGDVLVSGSIAGAGIDAMSNSGLWLYGPSGGELLAREGDAVSPSLPGVVYAAFHQAVLDDFGTTIVEATVRGPGVNASNNNVLVALRGTSKRVLVRTGDTIELPSMETRVASQIVFGENGAGRRATNHQRELVYRLRFTDQTDAIVLASDRCVADWDGSGQVNSADFFLFLTDFFNENADVNGDGVTASQDFFDFLASFFTSCE